MNVEGYQFPMLSGFLNLANHRHRVLANNIANVNTPGYHRLDVDFEQAFAAAVNGGDQEAFAELRPRVREITSGPMRRDGNNVDLAGEIGRLDRTTLTIRVFSEILALRLQAVRSAISSR